MELSGKSVVERLITLGYNINEGDSSTLDIAVKGCENYIKNYCNISEIPSELYSVAVDIAAGIFIKNKSAIGVNVNDNIDFEFEGIESIKEGDMTIEFNDNYGSAVEYKAFIDSLCNRDSELKPFRKLRW